jgi:enoyl-CoA hydratase/carnithine racemase
MTVANPVTLPLSDYKATHVAFAVAGKVATLTLNRPERKNPLTFESYAEIVDILRACAKDKGVKAIVLTGAGGNFCSGGDVFEIIGPLIEKDTVGLLEFTKMTGEVVKALRACPQPVVAAIDGVCAGAGAILAMASDIRFGTARTKIAFLFNRVGLAGCDMGACAMLPRIVGQGRASELLYTGRSLGGEEGERWGFFNRLCTPEAVLPEAQALARELAQGPSFANGITKTMLHQEWAMTIEQAIEAEAQAQALCMHTEDFRRAYRAFLAKQKPVFEGN